ncbi:MAG: aldo/keto reductase [Pseudomonadota bacterium]
MAQDITILPIGLGCSRLGSVNGSTRSEAVRLLNLALDGGIRFFDTSNVYGQGESERILGKIAAHHNTCVICTKGGRINSPRTHLVKPLKPLLRAAVRRSGKTRDRVKELRARGLGARWDGRHLKRSIEQSLRRLRRECIDIYLLHSPDASVLRSGEATDALDSALHQGLVARIGASVDSPEAARAALEDPRLTVLQLPFRPLESSFDAVISLATQKGVLLIAREIFQLPPFAPESSSFDYQLRLRRLLHDQPHALPLIGTLSEAHLKQAMIAAQAVTPAPAKPLFEIQAQPTAARA